MSCEACPLKGGTKVGSEFNLNAQFTIIGESPGQTEVKQGKPFVGPTGVLLWAALGSLGPAKIVRGDCNILNAISCVPPREGKQDVLAAAALCCKPRLLKELKAHHTPWLLTLGASARDVIFIRRDHEAPETRLGRWEWLPGLESYALASVHPAFVLRAPDNAKTLFDDLEKFARLSPVHFDLAPKFKVATCLDDIKCWAAGRREIYFDLETDQVEFMYRSILALGMCDENGGVLIVPGKHPQAPVELLYSTFDDPWWDEFWASDRAFVGHNAKFDARFLRWHFDWPVRVTDDTMLAHYITDERKKTHGLKQLAARWLDVPDYEAALGRHLSSRNDLYSKIPWDVLTKYLAMDVTCTRGLLPPLVEVMRQEETYDSPYRRIMVPLSNAILESELHGFMVDYNYVAEKSAHYLQEMVRLSEEVRKADPTGQLQNINSSKQLKVFLFETLKLPLTKPTTTRASKFKAGSTSATALEQLAGLHPVLIPLAEYRKYAKMMSSYFWNFLKFRDFENDRVHSDNVLISTESGRTVFKDPALQTLPRADEKEHLQFGRDVKDALISAPGNILICVDYSQAELRGAAAESREPTLIEAYREGKDAHAKVAEAMYGLNYSKTERGWAKMVNFSFLYGGTEHSFARTAAIPIEQAKTFIREYQSTMKCLIAWKNEQLRFINAYGYIRGRTGRRRRFPFISEQNEDEARKAAVNAPIQGGASDLTALSVIELTPLLVKYDAWILVTVHDSIVTECPLEFKDVVADLIQATMVRMGNSIYPEVPWKADVEMGHRWGSVYTMKRTPEGIWMEDKK